MYERSACGEGLSDAYEIVGQCTDKAEGKQPRHAVLQNIASRRRWNDFLGHQDSIFRAGILGHTGAPYVHWGLEPLEI